MASLSDYNAGTLHGTWLDTDQDLEDTQAGVAEMLDQSPTPGADEFAIHDYEGFGHYRVGERDSLDCVSRIAHGMDEHGLAYPAKGSSSESPGSQRRNASEPEGDFLGENRAALKAVLRHRNDARIYRWFARHS